MHLHMVFVGKTAFRDIDSAIERYIERIHHYVPLTVHLVKAERIAKSLSEEMVRERESERILSLVGKEDYLVLWDQRGKELDSVELARHMEQLMLQQASKVWMVIGGPVGVSRNLAQRAQEVLALSRMTLPHDLARLVVVEQLYRALTILRGEPYHK